MFSRKSEAKGMQEQLMTNPDMMQNMMKQQLTGLVPQVSSHNVVNIFTPQLSYMQVLATPETLLQIAMGAFVNYFFSGFIMGKVPFPLSPSFRLMLQVTYALYRKHRITAHKLNAAVVTSCQMHH